MATCAEPIRLIPGPQGAAGTNGTNGVAGVNSFTTLTANFTMPAVAATAVATVGDTSWIVIGQPLHLQNAGTLIPTAIGGATSVTLQNPTGYSDNVAATTVVPIGSKLGPGGRRGASGAGGAAGSGVSVTTVGDLQTHDGVSAARLAKGTDGQILVTDAAAGTDLAWKSIVPNASASTDNLFAVANTPLGTELPAPLQFIGTLKMTDTGAVQTVGGNARGVDAVDLQPARSAITQVASGDNSTIAGGRNSVASGSRSTVGGGEGHTASGANATVAGGAVNTATALYSTVAGGNTNNATDIGSTVGGGQFNDATNDNSVVAGGTNNDATGQNSTVGGGTLNQATASQAVVVGGGGNLASGISSAVLGGALNQATTNGAVASGFDALANKYAQRSHGAGNFAATGDSQISDLLWRITTTDATANVETFLDGTSLRAVVPNNTTWAFHILLSARSSTGTSACWEVKGGIKNDAGVVVLVAAVTTTVIADGTGGTWGVAGNFVVDADDPNNSLRLRVTGAAATTIRWTAHARIVEVGH